MKKVKFTYDEIRTLIIILTEFRNKPNDFMQKYYIKNM